MSNKKTVILIAVLVLLLGVSGCSGSNNGKVNGRRAVTELLDSAEAVMNDSPYYAYRLLDSIDSGSLRSRALNARYALVYSEVLYKNYIPAPNDSLIMIAVRYYSVGNHPEHLFRSFYSLGCIYNESGKLIDAAVALGQAEQLANKIDDKFRLGLLYSELGDVFFNSYDFQRAEQFYQLSDECFLKAGKEHHRMYNLASIAGCLMQLNDYEAAHSLYERVQIMAENYGDKILASSCILNQVFCSFHTKENEILDSEINQYISQYGIPHSDSKSISRFAQYYVQQNDLVTARELIDEAWRLSTPSDSVNLLYLESLYKDKIGQTDSSMVYYKKSIAKQNQNLRTLLSQPVLGAQKDYYKSLSELESLRASRNRNAALFLFIILVLLIVIIKIFNYTQTIKTESEKQGLLLTIKELRLKEDSNNETINLLNNRVNSLFVKQYAELDEVFDKMIELDNAFSADQGNSQLDEQQKNKRYFKKLELFHKRIRDRFEEIKSAKNQKALDQIINDVYDNIMVSLSDKKLKLSSNDILILRLLICGFSPKVVSCLLQEHSKYIYQKRNRIIKKIDQVSPELAIKLCNALRIR